MLKKIAIMLMGFTILVGGIALAWAEEKYPTYIYRYRLTVEIDTPDGVKSGSSVIQVTTKKMPDYLRTIARVTTEVEGEATYIDLGDGKFAVVVLQHGIWPKSNINDVLFTHAIFNVDCEAIDRLKWVEKIAEMQSAEAILPPVLIPNIITFLDVKDVSTSRFLYEAGYEGRCTKNKVVIVDNFFEILGNNYTLRKATVELTSDPVTKDISKNISWWDNKEAQDKLWKFFNTKERQ